MAHKPHPCALMTGGLFLLFLIPAVLHAGPLSVLEKKDIRVLHTRAIKPAAEDIARLYPALVSQLEGTFGWQLDLRPSVAILNDREHFQKLAESPLTVAFAVPEKALIVLDLTKLRGRPLELEMTLKHEICHLLLHHHIRGPGLPRWLNEGVCQWVSDGVMDIVSAQKFSLLNRAAVSGRFIPLMTLADDFPRSRNGIILAYEESKSFVDYIVRRFGKSGLLSILGRMKSGQDAGSAVFSAHSVTLMDLEKQWQRSITERGGWLTRLSFYVYELLFGIAGLALVFGAVKLFLKKRRYLNEERD